MNREQARNYLKSSGMSEEQIAEIESAFTCEDVISRQAVEEIINDIRDCISVEGYCAILERMKKLPSVSTEKTGRWIKNHNYSFYCSECDGEPYFDRSIYLYKWCPYCGAKMGEDGDKD